MRSILLIIVLIGTLPAQESDYFQQYVDYDIQVTLDDTNHTIMAYEKMVYQNNSPDTLNFIWFHIWPNAYKNDSTAFAKQAGENSRFSRSDATPRGFIDSLDFSIDGQMKVKTYTDWGLMESGIVFVKE